MTTKYHNFLQPAVLVALRKMTAPCRSCELAATMPGANFRSVQIILVKLAQGGWAMSRGSQKSRFWWATDKQGIPTSQWRNQHASGDQFDRSIEKTVIVKAERVIHPRPIQKHALDKAWGWT